MSQPVRKPGPALYDRDFHAWSKEQGRLLRQRSAGALDWENLAEEIETLGRSERSEIRSRIRVILLHLLKWQFHSDGRNAGWRASLVEQRDQLNEALDENPSLKRYPESVIDRQYRIARLKAAGETDLPVDSFPENCPYSLPEVLDETFYPGGDS